MLACPSFLRPADPVIATHAHLLGIVATCVVRAAEDLVLEIPALSMVFETRAGALLILIHELTVIIFLIVEINMI